MAVKANKPNTALGGCLMVVGFLLAGFFAFALLGFFVSETTDDGFGAFAIVFLFLLAGLSLIYAGLRSVRRNRRFADYVDLIRNQGQFSVEHIAMLTNRNIDQALKDVQATLNRRFLPGFRLDLEKKMIVPHNASGPPPLKHVYRWVCVSCGASNQVETYESSANCRYCNAPYLGKS